MKTRRKFPQLAAAAAVVAVLFTSACSSDSGKYYKFSTSTKFGTVIAPDDRKPVDDYSGTLLNISTGKVSGGSLKLSQFKGKVLLVNFWGSWCAPCRVETPSLADLYKEVAPKGVAFVGIDIKDDASDGADFAKSAGVTYPIVFDQPGKAIIKMGNSPGSPPFTYLIDKSGKVAAIYLGSLTPADLQPGIDKLLAEAG